MFITVYATKNESRNIREFRINLSQIESMEDFGTRTFIQANGERISGPSVKAVFPSGDIFYISGTSEILEARL